MNIQSNLSSIRAHQNWMSNNANNVANVNSDHYKPNNTTLVDDKGGNVTAKTTKANSNGSEKSQTNLTKEISEQSIIEKGVEANSKVIRSRDDMFGTILDIRT